VIHGELWDKNVMLAKLLNGRMEVMFTDWKNAAINSPTVDLAFFILSSTNAELRTNHLRQLLEKYFFTFTENLKRFDLNLAKDFPEFSFEAFVADFEQSLIGAFFQVHELNLIKIRRNYSRATK